MAIIGVKNGLNIIDNINEMKIGDMIPCKYTATSGVAGTFSELGTCITTEIPVVGSATPNGLFYFIKVDKGLLIADRVVQHNIPWGTLNAAKYISGEKIQGISLNIPFTNDLKDYSPNPKTINTNLVTIVTEESKYGTKSVKFNGTSTYIILPPSQDLNFKTGEFTIEFWFKAPSRTMPYPVLFCGATDHSGIFIGDDAGGGKLTFVVGDSRVLLSTNIPTDSIWHHCAITKKQGVLNLFYDGVINSQYNHTGAIDFSYNPMIGVGYWSTFNSYYNGYLNGFKIVKGKALYTENFIPIQTPPINDVKDISIRSLSGGNSYIDSNGLSSLTNHSLGAWPTNNEWDTYIVKSTLGGKITPGADNIWHNSSVTIGSYVQDTPALSVASSHRAIRGSYLTTNVNGIKGWNYVISTEPNATWGFRPALEYPENSNQANVWY